MTSKRVKSYIFADINSRKNIKNSIRSAIVFDLDDGSSSPADIFTFLKASGYFL